MSIPTTAAAPDPADSASRQLLGIDLLALLQEALNGEGDALPTPFGRPDVVLTRQGDLQ
jgi:hypothetical protein